MMSDRKEADRSGLMVQVYAALRELAAFRLKGERREHTLEATALVHDVYIKLAMEAPERWLNTAHFFNAAAEAMRLILIDYARARSRLKRGGESRKRVPLSHVIDVATLAETTDPDDILALDEALTRLEGLNAEAAAIVRLRFFGGRSVEQTAEIMAMAPSTVKRKWTYARAWIFRELSPSSPPEK
jgi:RNA polymerase sigma factor (TIGR02999 family)